MMEEKVTESSRRFWLVGKLREAYPDVIGEIIRHHTSTMEKVWFVHNFCLGTGGMSNRDVEHILHNPTAPSYLLGTGAVVEIPKSLLEETEEKEVVPTQANKNQDVLDILAVATKKKWPYMEVLHAHLGTLSADTIREIARKKEDIKLFHPRSVGWTNDTLCYKGKDMPLLPCFGSVERYHPQTCPTCPVLANCPLGLVAPVETRQEVLKTLLDLAEERHWPYQQALKAYLGDKVGTPQLREILEKAPTTVCFAPGSTSFTNDLIGFKGTSMPSLPCCGKFYERGGHAECLRCKATSGCQWAGKHNKKPASDPDLQSGGPLPGCFGEWEACGYPKEFCWARTHCVEEPSKKAIQDLKDWAETEKAAQKKKEEPEVTYTESVEKLGKPSCWGEWNPVECDDSCAVCDQCEKAIKEARLKRPQAFRDPEYDCWGQWEDDSVICRHCPASSFCRPTLKKEEEKVGVGVAPVPECWGHSPHTASVRCHACLMFASCCDKIIADRKEEKATMVTQNTSVTKSESPVAATLSMVTEAVKEGGKLSGSQTIAMLVAKTFECRVMGWQEESDKPKFMQNPLAQTMEPAVACMIAHLAALYFEGVPNREQVLAVCQYGMTASMKDAFDLLRPVLTPAFEAIAGMHKDLPREAQAVEKLDAKKEKVSK
jgi:hypothetical protein